MKGSTARFARLPHPARARRGACLAWAAAALAAACQGGGHEPASQRTTMRLEPPPATPVGLAASPAARAAARGRRGDAAAWLAPPVLEAPVLGVQVGAVRDNFGEPRGRRRHEGVDILMPRGTPVLAAVDGWIWSLKWDDRGGNTLHLLEASGHYMLLYAHLDGYAEGITRGRAVRAGEVLGYVGATGNASGTPHLHLRVARIRSAERWWEDVAIDPYPLLIEAVAP